jgi:aminoglycoside phosphotransferase (APT) family kinase protein
MSTRIVSRRESPYRTSFPIEELEVEISGHGRAGIVCKRLDREGLDATARLAKPLFLHAPEREIEVYERLLPRGPAGPPRFLGAELDAGRTLLFIERIEGRPLVEVGERELWEEAAGWLGRFHAAFADLPGGPPSGPLLIEHDADFNRFWLVRARSFAAPGPGPRSALAWLDARHEQVVEALSKMDRTLLHGEFYASNVLAAEGDGSTRIAAVDWELAGPGPAALDLAA